MYIPQIETERLRLRAHRRDDFEAICKMWMDPEFTKYIGGVPSTEHQCWIRLMGYAGYWDLLGYGYWAVEEKTSGKYVGGLGFADFKRFSDPKFFNLPEAGWGITPSMQGKGYAFEALQAAMDWGQKNLKVGKTFCAIHFENSCSLNLAKRLGFEEVSKDGLATFHIVQF